MANGIPCRKCGWQEADHDFMNQARRKDLSSAEKESAKASRPEGYEKIQSGYRASLKGCKIYVPEENPEEDVGS